MDLETVHSNAKKEFLTLAKSVLPVSDLLDIDFILQGEGEVSDAMIFELLRGWGNPALTQQFLTLPTVLGESMKPKAVEEPKQPVVYRTFDDEFL